MTETTRLYGPDGKVLPSSQLTQEVAAPTLMGIRSVWAFASAANNLTPARLATILASAAEGNAWDYLTLAEEMEEREPHYASVLGTRKRAVSGIEPTVEAASESDEDQKIAAAVRELTRKPEFGEAVDDLLDGLGKGYSAVEIVWDKGASWNPTYRWRDPRFFEIDREDGRTLRLMDEGLVNGSPLPPYRFIVHNPRIKSGIPIRGGLARLAAASYMCKSYTLKDWMAFAEIFGMPLRLGRYNSNATQKDIETLIKAVANIGSDAAAVLPDTMRIDFQEAAKGAGGHELFLKLAEWLDRQISKAVLGQTASSEGTPGKLGNDDAQDEVRKDIIKADAKALANTLNRDLVKPFVDINFGRREAYPRIMLSVHEPEDIEALTNALEKLVPLNLKVPAAWARDKLGIPDPEPDAELLGTLPPPADDATKGANKALNRANAKNPTEALDEIEEAMLAEWKPQMEPIINPVLVLADKVDSFDAFLEGLPGLLAEMDPEEVIKQMAEATFKARGQGDATDG
ncbi:hypothetical protein DSLASN_02380 [Desulfoluna limicola]|uniref:DUF935 domain-containing protein n=1 Tax=Desulfoluna limicola TaxID=2810562 RepID=A0ABM7PAF0_9BACT|nr:DUF935 domain-containing protein [Desulfoluna limicola]BCS94606.1 hypothetical protein DSLASN_02380 [Desulfoluna limicola]